MHRGSQNCADCEYAHMANLESQAQMNTVVRSNKSTPTLLGIPAELRNQINDDPEQPGLLRANQQLRNEATSIYCLNKPYVQIHELKLAPHPDHWFWNHNLAERRTLELRGPPHWTNFKEWLQVFYERGCGDEPSLARGIGDEQWDTLAEAFALVKLFKESPWETIEKALEIFKTVVEGIEDKIMFE